MAEPESILQLGIEAARDGNKEQARSLFRLLTMQEPNNAQAWLWLAGVAENREERQAALERVVALEPENEMALKGLQALGVRPGSHLRSEPAEPVPPPIFSTEEEEASPSAPTQAAATRDRYDIDEDDPFAALDTLSEAMNEAPAAVRRSESAFESTEGRSERAATAGMPTPILVTPPRGSATQRTVDITDDDEETVPARRGISPLLIGLVGLGLIVLLVFILWPFLFGNGTASQPTPGPGAGAAATNQAATQAALAATTTVGTPSSGGLATTPGSEVPTTTAEATVIPTTAPTAPAPGVTDPAAANPAVVPPNTPLESNGWLYDFQRSTYAAPIIGNLGNFQPQGRFVVVLVFLANRTGQTQVIPTDFFVLKDAQGRVYTPRPEVSSVYVIPGVNADLSQEQAIPANGLTTSVALIFDVAPDATDLVFFARSNPQQGWLVLQRI